MPNGPDHPEGWPRLKRKLRPRLRRVVVQLAYDGAAFSGFQRQPERRTVEGDLIEALLALGLTGGLGFASRTDAGVHAEGQVVAFKVPESINLESLTEALRANLRSDIHVRRLAWAPAKFHPRWSAISKQYLYRLDAAGPDVISVEALRIAVAELLECSTLSGFTGAGVEKTDAPPLTALLVESAPTGGLQLRFEGPAFKRYGIRHMVGALLQQARGVWLPGECARVAAREPPYRGPRAPAEGLTLVRIDYPPEIDPFREGAVALPIREPALEEVP